MIEINEESLKDILFSLKVFRDYQLVKSKVIRYESSDIKKINHYVTKVCNECVSIEKYLNNRDFNAIEGYWNLGIKEFTHGFIIEDDEDEMELEFLMNKFESEYFVLNKDIIGDSFTDILKFYNIDVYENNGFSYLVNSKVETIEWFENEYLRVLKKMDSKSDEYEVMLDIIKSVYESCGLGRKAIGARLTLNKKDEISLELIGLKIDMGVMTSKRKYLESVVPIYIRNIIMLKIIKDNLVEKGLDLF